MISATLSEENKHDEKDQEDFGKNRSGRPNTQMGTSLGKVHLTKRMQQERELFLGVSSRPTRGSKASKETALSGNQ